MNDIICLNTLGVYRALRGGAAPTDVFNALLVRGTCPHDAEVFLRCAAAMRTAEGPTAAQPELR